MSIPKPQARSRTLAVAVVVALGMAGGAAAHAGSTGSGQGTTVDSSAAASSGSTVVTRAPKATSIQPAPTSTSTATYTLYSNLAYVPGGNSQQILDLYVPKNTHGRPVPLIVYVHGGGWLAGDKSELQGNAGWESYLSEGFAIASIDYTLSETAIFPQQIYDVNASIRYLRVNAPKYHMNGNEIGLWGESAGGQLVALAGATCGVPSLEGHEGVSDRVSSCVQAVVDGFGPTDFLQMDSHLYNSSSLHHDPAGSPESMYLGCTEGLLACAPSTVERADPITYLTNSSVKLPPYLIVHGDVDTLVPNWESRILFSALASVCDNATFYTMHGLGHGAAITVALSNPSTPQTVQSTHDCGAVSTSSGPALTWAGLGSFFESALS